MCKPMVVTLPFVLLLLDYWPLHRAAFTRTDARTWLNLLLEKAPLIFFVIISSAITISTQRRSGAMKSLLELPWQLRISNIPLSYINYLWKWIWPVKLAVFYPLHSPIPLWQRTSATALLLVMTALAFAAANRQPY